MARVALRPVTASVLRRRKALAKPEPLRASDAQTGRRFDVEGVAIEIVEVNRVKNPFGPDSFLIAYRVRDSRQAPPFISQVAHLPVGLDANLTDKFNEIRSHYEQVKSMLRD